MNNAYVLYICGASFVHWTGVSVNLCDSLALSPFRVLVYVEGRGGHIRVHRCLGRYGTLLPTDVQIEKGAMQRPAIAHSLLNLLDRS